MTAARIRLDRMSETEYQQFTAIAIPDYADEKVRAGTWPREEALDRARATFAQLLPAGVTSPDNHLFTVRDAAEDAAEGKGEAVGWLWFALRGEPGRREAYLYNIVVHEPFRGRGYGRAAMLACATAAREHGANSVGLHVFGSNTVARKLYTSLGFAETGVLMSLPLDAA
ncbi:GNAT family N-acetyltransferase [Streptomyces sp. DSM 44915]|uniref:GNAT family N-acetyltransferase n=1 Tax=Streptomyces chisholmiae TaxID=3075540 RepID=A0ABU2JU39_9ACTN|nr:GNAT family N-acetyltransferase [Streptomyces sp. DSM 44915]MDT0268487.1 GNAT family N-acetyltransferase [Streptomyces sp. DSM 44915]